MGNLALMKFLTGQFRHIILLNYETDPLLLTPYLPARTELDFHNGNTYLSLVGLQSFALRVYSLPFPFYRHHAQVNLRFYVRYRTGPTSWRHGVVFINQIIPHRVIAWAVHRIFKETVICRRVDERIEKTGSNRELVEYSWPWLQHRLYIRTAFRRHEQERVPAADRDFFVQRYWGYSGLRGGGCLEYNFSHPPWDTYRGDVAAAAAVREFYGPPFSEILRSDPDSAFGCSGSEITLALGHSL
jgi:uncharacterized protein YqjF (DUF2071 family)